MCLGWAGYPAEMRRWQEVRSSVVDREKKYVMGKDAREDEERGKEKKREGCHENNKELRPKNAAKKSLSAHKPPAVTIPDTILGGVEKVRDADNLEPGYPIMGHQDSFTSDR